MSLDALQEYTSHCVTVGIMCLLLLNFMGGNVYILVVFLGLGMVLVIVVVPGQKEFSVESGTYLHIANLGTSQRYKGGGLAQQGSPGLADNQSLLQLLPIFWVISSSILHPCLLPPNPSRCSTHAK